MPPVLTQDQHGSSASSMELLNQVGAALFNYKSFLCYCLLIKLDASVSTVSDFVWEGSNSITGWRITSLYGTTWSPVPVYTHTQNTHRYVYIQDNQQRDPRDKND